MTNEKPKFKGNIEVALWEKKDKNGKLYYSCKVSQYCNLFEVSDPK